MPLKPYQGETATGSHTGIGNDRGSIPGSRARQGLSATPSPTRRIDKSHLVIPATDRLWTHSGHAARTAGGYNLVVRTGKLRLRRL
jgi:hypothetical protein